MANIFPLTGTDLLLKKQLGSDNKSLHVKVSELAAALSENATSMEGVNTALEELSTSLEGVSSDIADVKGVADANAEAISGVKEVVDANAEAISDLDSDVAAVKGVADANAEALSDLDSDVAEVKGVADANAEAIAGVKEVVDDNAEALETLDGKADSIIEDTEAIQAFLGDSESFVLGEQKVTLAEVIGMDAYIASHSDEEGAANSIVEKLNAISEAIAGLGSEALSDLSKDVEAVDNKIEDLSSDVETLAGKVGESTDEAGASVFGDTRAIYSEVHSPVESAATLSNRVDNIAEAVDALAGAVGGIQNNTRTTISMQSEMVIPSAGPKGEATERYYLIRVNNFDTEGGMKDATVASLSVQSISQETEIRVPFENCLGYFDQPGSFVLSNNLIRVGEGQYEIYFKSTSEQTPASLLFTFEIGEDYSDPENGTVTDPEDSRRFLDRMAKLVATASADWNADSATKLDTAATNSAYILEDTEDIQSQLSDIKGAGAFNPETNSLVAITDDIATVQTSIDHNIIGVNPGEQGYAQSQPTLTNIFAEEKANGEALADLASAFEQSGTDTVDAIVKSLGGYEDDENGGTTSVYDAATDSLHSISQKVDSVEDQLADVEEGINTALDLMAGMSTDDDGNLVKVFEADNDNLHAISQKIDGAEEGIYGAFDLIAGVDPENTDEQGNPLRIFDEKEDSLHAISQKVSDIAANTAANPSAFQVSYPGDSKTLSVEINQVNSPILSLDLPAGVSAANIKEIRVAPVDGYQGEFGFRLSESISFDRGDELISVDGLSVTDSYDTIRIATDLIFMNNEAGNDGSAGLNRMYFQIYIPEASVNHPTGDFSVSIRGIVLERQGE